MQVRHNWHLLVSWHYLAWPLSSGSLRLCGASQYLQNPRQLQGSLCRVLCDRRPLGHCPRDPFAELPLPNPLAIRLPLLSSPAERVPVPVPLGTMCSLCAERS